MEKSTKIIDKDAIKREFDELVQWGHSLSKRQIDFLCDGGWYNNAIHGYLIKAAEFADMNDEQINALLEGLDAALDSFDKQDAEKIYSKR